MLPYYCNEAMVLLPSVQSMIDRTRHAIEVVTEDGVALDLVIARIALAPDETLHGAVDKALEEQRRSLRGFQILSKTEGEYAGLFGVELKTRFFDASHGPRFHHAFHTVIDGERVGFFGISTMEDAPACEAWMSTLLSNLKVRS